MPTTGTMLQKVCFCGWAFSIPGLSDARGCANIAMQKPASKSRPPFGRRPGCTHINMVIIRSPGLTCDQCGKTPNSGMLFACEQDAMAGPLNASATSLHNKLLKGFRRQSYQFKSMGFNPSIVRAVSQGLYTAEEMEHLKIQKVAARQAVDRSLALQNEMNDRRHMKRPLPGIPGEVMSTDPKHRDDDDGVSPNHTQTCHLKVCLGCRPMSRARSFVSFDSVFKNEITIPRAWRNETMPVSKASICRTLGLGSQFRASTSDGAKAAAAIRRHSADASIRDMTTTATKPRLRCLPAFSQFPAAVISSAIPNSLQPRTPSTHDLRRVDATPDLRLDSIITPCLPFQECPSSIGFRDSIKRGYDDILHEDFEHSTPEEQAAASAEVQRLLRLERRGRPNDYNLQTWKAMMDRVLARAAATALPDEDGDDGLSEHDTDSCESTASNTSERASTSEHDQWMATQLGAIVEERASQLELQDLLHAVDWAASVAID